MSKKLPYFGPLNFSQNDRSLFQYLTLESEETDCPLCDFNALLPVNEKDLLTHMFMAHRLVIADVHKVADLRIYITFWKTKLTDTNLEFYCTTLLMDQTPDGKESKDEKYYLLSDVLPMDKKIRADIQKEKLDKLLMQHKREREDATYERECLFCRHTCKDTRSNYLKHLYDKHNVHIAKVENLVFVGELIDLVGAKLESLVCIYCEKVFKDRNILKEHMRKKGHKRINPANKEYDKFFLVNYLEPGQTWQVPDLNKPKPTRSISGQSHKSDTRSIPDDPDSDPDWSAWEEKNEQKITCLFCTLAQNKYGDTLAHMKSAHTFDFCTITKSNDFYQKVKIVNYIRKQIHVNQCTICEAEYENNESLLRHMSEQEHFGVTESLWNQPEYYFPTYEDDPFLCSLEDDEEGTNEHSEKYDGDISEQVALSVLNED